MKYLVIVALMLFSLPSFAEDKLKVGFIVALSGPLAESGVAIKNGVTLAAEDNPRKQNVFTAVYEDSEYQSRKAVSAIHQLNQQEVDAVYVYGGPMTEALSPIAEKLQLPMFSTEYDTKYTKGKKYVIRFANNAADYGKVLFQGVQQTGARKIGILKSENQYHNTLAEAFISVKPEAELVFNFQPGERDFRSVFPVLRAKQYDAIGLYLLPASQSAFLKQAKSSGFKQVQFFGTDSFQSASVTAGVEDLVEGSLWANSVVSQSFRLQYQQRFGNVDQLVHAALAYEFSRLVNDLFKQPRTVKSSDQLIDKFKIKQGRDSVCGKYYFKNSESTGQYFSFPLVLWQVKGGAVKMISKAGS